VSSTTFTGALSTDAAQAGNWTNGTPGSGTTLASIAASGTYAAASPFQVDGFTTELNEGVTFTLSDVSFGAGSTLTVDTSAYDNWVGAQPPGEVVLSTTNFSNAGLITVNGAEHLDIAAQNGAVTFTNTGTLAATASGADIDLDNYNNTASATVGSFVNDGLLAATTVGANIEAYGTTGIGGGGTIDLSNGGNLVLEANTINNGNQTINMLDGNGDWVVIADDTGSLINGTFADTINVSTALGGSNSDALIFANPDGSGVASLTYNAATAELGVTYNSGSTVDFFVTAPGAVNAGDFSASPWAGADGGLYFPLLSETTAPSGYEIVEFACFCPGTLIATPRGGVAVEALQAGDMVLTAEGPMPVRWLGVSHVSPRFADPMRVSPIRIAKGALGNGLPARDLRLSADHAVFIGGVLVQAGALVNGTTIVRETVSADTLTYYHVELPRHALLYAEGLESESYVDNVSSWCFANASTRPASGPVAEMPYPRVKAARQLPRNLRNALLPAVAA
jgi:hypothetical protein